MSVLRRMLGMVIVSILISLGWASLIAVADESSDVSHFLIHWGVGAALVLVSMLISIGVYYAVELLIIEKKERS